MPNRLADETSPYLLQHKDNPVDWYPWGDEAFAKAREEQKPVFLSVGYSSCHWCHVMEHESFEDAEVAALLNRSFVSVKVDREERPDVDEAYMTAVQLSSGRGGWPMSVFLTPGKQPFFAGTYFPKSDIQGHPGFLSVLTQIERAWQANRSELMKAADEFGQALSEVRHKTPPGTFAKLDEEFLAGAVQALVGDFDSEHGGFGQAPKFPPHTSIEFLLNYAMRGDAPEEMRDAAVSIAFGTLEAMALGGIHDHVGGGFHRYSTDERWLLPHFEKMLYDNALMLGNYARAAELCRGADEELRRLFMGVVIDTVHWLEREMRSPEGLYFSALDADSEGEEGKFYVWTIGEVREVLGERADAFVEAYGFAPQGNYLDEATHRQTGANIPNLEEDQRGQFDKDLEKLRESRDRRVRPGLDDKAVISWNGLAISALVDATLVPQAERIAEAILEIERREGKLPHQVSKGIASGEAFLDDYACFIDGLFRLAAYRDFLADNRLQLEAEGYEVDRVMLAKDWRTDAERLTAKMIELFYDEEGGGFFYTSSQHEELFGRTKPVFDQPQPSGNAIAIRCLVEVGDQERARKSITAFLGWMERAPQATEALFTSALPLVEGDETPKLSLPSGEVSVSLSERELIADQSGVARGSVVMSVPKGLHLNSSTPPANWLTPTKLQIAPVRAQIEYPTAQDDRYEGEVEILFNVELPAGERGAEFEVRVSYQACTDFECQLPQEKVLSGVVVRK